MPITEDSSKLWKFENLRADGKIAVMLDNNVWNWLFDNRTAMSLRSELPVDRFAVYIPREVEIEYLAIPAQKEALKSFINTVIDECAIKTTSYFGFEVPGVQRNGTFGFGTFMDSKTSKRIDTFRHYMHGSRPTGLAHNETDLMLAVEAFNCVILTRDRKKDPLLEAKSRGGKVLHVEDRHVISGELRAAIIALWPYAVSATS